MRTINLSGPSGNAFALMGIAKNTAKQLGWESSAIDKLIKDMMSGDYEHLIDIFETNFSELIELRGSEVI
ncbi:unnamed protein product [marine sediment metagenome]|uniref:Uncharacterized protein n=1 Tax=marine sediment metagenome TaxID=412755 RepID=X0W483_9ZZZZ